MNYSPPGSSVHEILQDKYTGVGCHFLFQGIFPGIEPEFLVSPALADGFFTTEPPGEPRDILKYIYIFFLIGPFLYIDIIWRLSWYQGLHILLTTLSSKDK